MAEQPSGRIEPREQWQTNAQFPSPRTVLSVVLSSASMRHTLRSQLLPSVR